MVEINDLRLVIIPCREPVPLGCRAEYNKAYELWSEVWSKTLKELDGVEKLSSNEFTRHDYASVIFKGDEAVSLMCYSEVDLSLKSRQEDAWFQSWPKEFLEKQGDGLGIIAAWFCTDEKFRKGSSKLSVNTSKLITEVFAKIILDGPYTLGYGITRNNRGVGKYGEDLGATVLTTSRAYGCEVNLILLEPEALSIKQFTYTRGLRDLWNKRSDYRGNYVEREIRKAA